MTIPIIDIFAGPGGLGEGFSALTDTAGNKLFKIALSIEKDFHAHQTLTLRSFFRQFEKGAVPKDYYDFIQGKITLDSLYDRWPEHSRHAKNEAWCATLGEGKDAVPNSEVDRRIDDALQGKKDWVLIGGPPCQAYSVVGRVRRQERVLDETKDERVGLYKHYLRILAVHNPSVFVMENVKGLLSAETLKSPVFSKILSDLSNPVKAYLADFRRNGRSLDCPGYKIFSLVVRPKLDPTGNPIFNHKDFLIEAEKYGIPQARHRVILLGIRNDIKYLPDTLKIEKEVPISKVLAGLPRLRSGLSRSEDGGENWKNIISQTFKRGMLTGIDDEVKEEMLKQFEQIRLPHQGTGSEYIAYEEIGIEYKESWFIDKRLKGISNHSSRGHMESDLHRYFFVSCFAKIKGFSPMLTDFPISLLPSHKNVFIKDGGITRKFADRFRVQVRNKPSKTITSHISQDGHYYIHPDPTQCRSLTVREAARIQTFPDNYHFCGPRTAQFIQVGNAVPPLLANKIASIVHEVFAKKKTRMMKNKAISKEPVLI